MKIKFIGKVIKIGSSYGVIIPKKQLDALGINAGDKVVVSFELVNKKS